MLILAPHMKNWKFKVVGGGISVRSKNLKKCMKLNCNFQRGGWGDLKKKIVLHRGGMDIFYNYTKHV